MLIIEGLSAKEVSEQLGVAENMLYRWNQEHLDELEASKPAEAQSPKEMAEPSNHRCSATRSSGTTCAVVANSSIKRRKVGTGRGGQRRSGSSLTR